MEEKGENTAKEVTPLCFKSEVPIIPFMLRQEMADIVRKRLIKHCCRNQHRLLLDPNGKQSRVPLQTALHIDRVVCENIHVLYRPTESEQHCQNRGGLSNMPS